MSVLFKGMDMPRNCKECDYLYGSLREGYRCRGLEKWLDVAVDAKRDPDCPIVAVPTPHGDLIDRDHLLDMLDKIILKPDSYDQRCRAIATKEIVICQLPVIKAEGES